MTTLHQTEFLSRMDLILCSSSAPVSPARALSGPEARPRRMLRSPEVKDDAMECPLCMEPLEIDDVNFFPCTCGYQICRFCWHRIRTDENGLCPACRKVEPVETTERSQASVYAADLGMRDRYSVFGEAALCKRTMLNLLSSTFAVINVRWSLYHIKVALKEKRHSCFLSPLLSTNSI